MNKRLFIYLMVLTIALTAGFLYYIRTQISELEPVERISIKWWDSSHADIDSVAFTNWNEDDPPEVPVRCAKCHSGHGFIDYLGQDGSEAMLVDSPGAIESVISCMVCHNEKADALGSVEFPSGISLEIGEGDALCASCHSVLTAGSAVDNASADYQADELIEEGRFVSPHYAFAASTWLGTEAQGGYEYLGKEYVGKFYHANGVESCTKCHDPHSLRMRTGITDRQVELCAACHSNVTGRADYPDIFVDGIDYDGDGQVMGLYYEIEGMKALLMQAIQQYAKESIGIAIGWADQSPFLFIDTDQDGTISSEEATRANAYTTFTPRLMRAAFNYQFSKKDAAGYVHNGKYILQLLYDAIEDLASITGFPMSNLVRP
jgi:doubled CXXCH domain